MSDTFKEYLEKMRNMYNTRIETCKSCEELRPIINQCKVCGCFVYAKTAIENAECPLGKW